MFRDQGWNVVATMRKPSDQAGLESATVRTLALDVTDALTIMPSESKER